MGGAADSAKKVKQTLRSLRAKLGKTPRLAPSDPITQLILGIFSRDLPEARARDVLARLGAMVVDHNELRVIPPIELTEIVGDVSDARLKCEDLSRALNRIFAVEHVVSLDHLASAPLNEVNAYLDQIDGLEPYTRARIKLLGLNRHAVPLDEAMLAYVRDHELAPARGTHEAAQAFLARQIPEKDALLDVALLKKVAWADFAAAVRKRTVERILSVPPDRTSRNMLRSVASAADGHPADEPGAQAELAAASPELADGDEAPASVEGERASGAKPARKKPPTKSRPRTPGSKPKTPAGARRSSEKKAAKPKSAARSRS